MSAPAEPAPAPLDRRLLTLLVVPILAITACSYVGSGLMPTLIDDRPEIVLALSSPNRHLLLAIGANIAPVAFFVIGFVRLIVPDPLYYALGYRFGVQGRAWLARQPGGVPWTVSWTERAFDKTSWVAVIMMPNGIVSLLAGMHRMPFRTFLALNAIGTAGRLGLLWVLGKAFEDELKEVVDFIARYQWWLVAAFVVFSVIQSTIQASRIPAPADDAEEPAAE